MMVLSTVDYCAFMWDKGICFCHPTRHAQHLLKDTAILFELMAANIAGAKRPRHCNASPHCIIFATPPPPPEGSWKPKYKMRNWIESRNSKGAVVVVLVALAIATDLTKQFKEFLFEFCLYVDMY
jgi:hypothetical protein